MKIAILGAGNLGLAQAGHLASLGHSVALYNRSTARIESLLRGGPIALSGALSTSAHLSGVSSDLAQVVRDAELIFVDTPASAHAALAVSLRAALPKTFSGAILLHPGQTFGARDFTRTLVAEGARFPDAIFGEIQTALYTARAMGPTTVNVLALKRQVGFAAYPAVSAARLKPTLALYPQLLLEQSALATSLSNVQAFIHPAICLFNLARIERGEPFKIYRQGIGHGVGVFVEACDAERLALAERLGVPVPSALAWFERGYGVRAPNIVSAMEKIEAYDVLMGPTNLSTRLLTEDVPTGLAPLVELCVAFGVPCSNLSALLTACRTILGQDALVAERTLAGLGIAGLDADELRAAFEALRTPGPT